MDITIAGSYVPTSSVLKTVIKIISALIAMKAIFMELVGDMFGMSQTTWKGLGITNNNPFKRRTSYPAAFYP